MIKLCCSIFCCWLTFCQVAVPQSGTTAVPTAAQAIAPDSIPEQYSPIADQANIFSAGELHTLDSLLAHFKRHDSVNIILITLNASMVNKDNFDLTVNTTREAWAAETGKDNGVAVGFSKDLRKIRISTGRELISQFTDTEAQQVIDSVCIPAFKQGKYYEGLVNGLHSIVAKINN